MGTTSLGLWANSVNLRFNKCKAMILSRRKRVATPCPLLLNGQPVDFVDSIRYLGWPFPLIFSSSCILRPSLPKQGN